MMTTIIAHVTGMAEIVVAIKYKKCIVRSAHVWTLANSKKKNVAETNSVSSKILWVTAFAMMATTIAVVIGIKVTVVAPSTKNIALLAGVLIPATKITFP